MESHPKWLIFKQNDLGATKLELRQGISVCGSEWCGICMEFNESRESVLGADVNDVQVLQFYSYVVLGAWCSD